MGNARYTCHKFAFPTRFRNPCHSYNHNGSTGYLEAQGDRFSCNRLGKLTMA
ncbi:hypothetical protein AVDCRST_MAG84-4573 [uncultured Microcoleus sp.]|uniref:Uncharacterized protein n=1 Tax=uncultured Microcoleus sp. TaxID=259945 RepID=A0A6J4N0T0_9CYAN|nr:hypothetical protein AVDCRST_MAG84-4573 [uncultured Microcoleus sp.]